ncbi:MAG: SDR family oxidoreductase [Planctomycetota bacterium]|nr:SDR family oxidoreductase [Planctomycetota bacterium]
MDLALKDKVVFITGASGGIGRALAEAFAAEGAKLALTGNDAIESLRSWVKAQPRAKEMLALACNTTDPAQVDAAMEQARAQFGRVDVAIANAGRWTPEFALAHRATPERIRDNITINLLGSMWTARAFMSALEKSGARTDGVGASLVFIGSTAGRFGEKGHAEYSAGKAGLYGLVRSLKNEIVELDPFARVNMIEPGWTVTHMARAALQQPGVIAKVVRTMPLRQLARAEDIAKAALFLCSPALSRHVSGEVVTVAGGMEGRSLWESDQVDEAAIRRRVGD